MYAILDIETTGGKYDEESITEIAIYQFNGHEITDRFISLINPEREIQPFVVNLTGINNTMLYKAPKFYEVAKRIVEITENCILVAHNARFDYRILKTEFQRLGFQYKRQTLCTVELSQKLIPGKDSYSLGKLTRALGIPVNDRHRANGDALATTQLFKLLLTKDNDKTIIKKVVRNEIFARKKSKWLNIIENLPSKTGVYYIHQSDGTIIYIGKSKNIKAKVNQHFASSSATATALQEKAFTVTYEETGTELIASLKAYQEIKLHRPLYNPYYTKPIFPRMSDYLHQNMIVIDKGRFIDERSAILIEEGWFKGFGFFNLNYQLNNIAILRSIITPMERDEDVNYIVQSYLRKRKVLKIIPY